MWKVVSPSYIKESGIWGEMKVWGEGVFQKRVIQGEKGRNRRIKNEKKMTFEETRKCYIYIFIDLVFVLMNIRMF